MDFRAIVDPSAMTAAAQWLNNTFGAMDKAILTFYHNCHEVCGKPLDVFVQLFTKLGDGGIFLLVLAACLMLFRKTRKVGLGMFIGVAVGAVFTNLTIKPFVDRPRPYDTLELYRGWFQQIWHWAIEGEHQSFPSGHTTAAMAAMTPVFFFCNKKKSWAAFLFVIALGATRNYIMVHFPSDILGGMIVGFCAGFVSYLIVNAIWKKFEPKNSLLIRADLPDLFRKKKAS